MSANKLTVRSAGRKEAKFSLGALLMTPGIQDLMTNRDLNPLYFVGRHLTGDWGDVAEDDASQNDSALLTGGRLISAYDVPDPQVRIWVITEADRSSTTVLLPSEY